ncbi:cation:proton antiporter [Ferrimonas lipolytica]|uniref:Sodium:proton antiporter n=1 Tax=Ferrimonas lipolytica TaxID=2724191 RepID=A0A6H1UCZ5_9GAMM|nr:sodium:proton antiporter [Ferrimonas lipolytica]QIZ76941.1 sodium:proton antiporter [Ferrimonas lipolytica]
METLLLLGQVLAFVLMATIGCIIHRITKLDITLSCLGSGVLAALIVTLFGFDLGLRANDVKDQVFYLLLPVLVFQAAWHLKPDLLKKWLTPAMLLATVGVLITCLLCGFGLYWGIGHPAAFPLSTALIGGAILSATDPIAVVATLVRLKAPEDLATLFETESLLNDGTAIVLFGIVMAVATGEMSQPAILPVLLKFCVVFFGGMVVGAICGWLGMWTIRLLQGQQQSMLVLLLLAFGSFFVAEHFLHVSGIMATAVSALVCQIQLHKHPHLYKQLSSGLDWFGLLFNLLIFCLMGVVLTADMFTERYLAIGIAIIAAVAARFASVYLCQTALSAVGKPLPAGWPLLLSWGGLRGAIAIALVLSLPTEIPGWWTIQSMVFGVVLFSLLVQGTSFGPLLRRQQATKP